ncbi:bifunctional UDP-sugar hydrolase/5'-nucleotidase [Isoptericola sp. b515]|uniref:bifunctional metallophosphatase/5'-nucleotidase n=1 Tax=Isoptericola sp. b515 TaxID=3064652 RepID=UPI0027128B43|nr:bifunctional UDP-sugar hydrolase/5'-nucleotidase [Isoptericola sp. b515]MDO8147475.1 bifunctional UDP-sugar hydrolase/5'-nucleotidase [Isoptericola sp. b515]
MLTARKRVAGFAAFGLAATGVATVGALPAQAADPVDVQILATNDFHGRILPNSYSGDAGAAVLAGAVDQLRTENPNTVFAAAGDLIGASTFESFIQHDRPTIQAMNEAGLDVSAVGNHELDGGYSDLVDRVMADHDPVTNPFGGAEWEYVAANLKMRATGDDAVPASWLTERGGVEIGFVGAVTEDLPFLVSPAGIEEIEVTDIVDAANAEADALRAEGADLVVLLVHEGATSTDCADITDGAFGEIVTGLDGDTDAIVSGHTHLAYDCRVPVAEWSDRAVTERPVVSAGQYGVNLNQLEFSVDPDSGDVTGLQTDVLPLFGNYPADPEVQAIVDEAVEVADELGAEPLGEVADVLNRAKRWTVDADTGEDVLVENRGGESTLGNLVAEVQRWATSSEESGSAEIAFMNPGGLRADLTGDPAADFPRTITYKEAAVVQPFANTLVNMDLTGEQIKTALEQQWQRDDEGDVPSRPFLRLGASDGFEYTYDDSRPEGDRITGMWLHGEAIDPAAAYSVTVNSFLAAGGDNFRVFAEGADASDTGKIDLSAFVDYMAEFAGDTPLEADPSQRAVGVSFTENADLKAGKQTAFDVSSWSMSTAADTKDDELVVMVDGEKVGSFPVDNTVTDSVYDVTGTASVSLKLPKKTEGTLTLVGMSTGTEVVVGEVTAPGKPAGLPGPPSWVPAPFNG